MPKLLLDSVSSLSAIHPHTRSVSPHHSSPSSFTMKSPILKTVLVFIGSLISISDGQLLGIIPAPNPTAILNSAQLIAEATALKASVTSIDPNVNLTSLPSSIVSLPGGLTLNLTELYGPIQQVCPRTGIIGKLACMICSNDCTYTHNKYGGAVELLEKLM